MSQSGMARRHYTRRQPGWKRGFVINGFGAVLTGVVDVVIAVTKFKSGAWVILLAIPILVLLLLRLNRQYASEDTALQVDAPRAATAPILRRHVVLVFVDRLDLASARAIQYARSLMPDELRAVHFVVDVQRAESLLADWQRLGLSGVTLQLYECADRVIPRAAIEATAEVLADGETEVSVLLPHRKYRGLWHRILHDRTADSITEEVSRLPHANVTLVPFHLGDSPSPKIIPITRPRAHRRLVPTGAGRLAPSEPVDAQRADGTTPVAFVRFRQRAKVRGRVRSLRVHPLAGTPTLECIIADDTGQVSVVFLGRRQIAGIEVGRTLAVEGMLGSYQRRLCFLNPHYELE
jgi:hypothetical protein